VHRCSDVERAGDFLPVGDGDALWYGHGHLEASGGGQREWYGHAYRDHLGCHGAKPGGHGAATREPHDLEADDGPG
jgi:hypothetical protein